MKNEEGNIGMYSQDAMAMAQSRTMVERAFCKKGKATVLVHHRVAYGNVQPLVSHQTQRETGEEMAEQEFGKCCRLSDVLLDR